MHVRTKSLQAVGIVAVGFALVLLAGCGSSPAKGSATTGSSVTTTASAADSRSGPATASAGGGTKAVDVCAAIDAAKAKSLSGEDITSAVPRTDLQDKEWGCGYSNDDSSVQVQVSVFEHDAASSYDLFASQSKDKVSVTGVGEKAFYDNDGTLYALRGDALIQVNGVDSADKCAALAKAILGDI